MKSSSTQKSDRSGVPARPPADPDEIHRMTPADNLWNDDDPAEASADLVALPI